MTTLKRLLPSQEVDALLGDIVEESRRRSRLWFWAQMTAVVLFASYREASKHPLVTLRAIGVGAVTLIVAFAPAPALLQVARVMSEGPGYHVGPYWLTLPPNAFRYLPTFVNVVGFFASGWMIARRDRPRGIAMVLPWTFLVCGLPAYAIVDFLIYHGTSIVWTGPRTLGLLSSLSLPTWVLLGGVLGLRSRRLGHS